MGNHYPLIACYQIISLITFPISFRYGMIDYTAVVDRRDDVPGQPVNYTVNELIPANNDVARTYIFAAPESLNYPINPNPLLSKAIALEIKRKVAAMKIDLG